VLVVDGQLHGHSQSHSARNDGDFVKWIRVRQLYRYQRVPGFVIGRHFLLFVGEQQ